MSKIETAIASAQYKCTTGKMTKFRWVVIFIIFIIYTIASADRANLGVALPFIRKEVIMSNTEAGAIASLFFVGYALFQIPAGFIYSKIGVHKVFSLAMILTSAFTALIGTSSSLFALKAFRLGLGISEAALPVGITTTINNWFPSKEKGTATGIFLAGAKFGPVIVPPIAVAVLTIAGWRPIFYVFAVPGILLSIIWYFLVKNKPGNSPHCSASEVEYIKTETIVKKKVDCNKNNNSLQWLDKLIRTRMVEPLSSNAQLFRSWNLWGTALGYFFMVGIVNVILAWIPTYLINEKHFSIMHMGFVASAPWVGAVVGNILDGWFSDKVLNKRRKPLMLVSALATAGMMYALVNSTNDAMVMGLLLLATGALLNLGYSAFMVYPMGLATKEKYPIAMAIVNTGGQLGGAAAPLVVGMILDAYNWGTVFLSLAIGALICLAIILTTIEPISKPTDVTTTNA